MKMFRRAGAACAGVSAAVLLLVMAVPAQAATTGWRQVFSTHYGAGVNASYEAVVAPGKTSAWALGGAGGSPDNGTPVAEHWNGKDWNAVRMPAGTTGGIFAASAVSVTDIWAVTILNGYVLHWNGSRWSVAKHLAGFGEELTGVTALSATNVWVFGGSGEFPGLGTWHFNGKTWQQWKGNIARGLENASALSATSIWAIGTGPLLPYSAIDHFNGRSWQVVSAKALSGLQFWSIHAFSRTDVWVSAVTNGIGQSARLVHFNGRTWTRIRVPPSRENNVFASDGRGGLWLSGRTFTGQPYIAHRSSAGVWSRISIPVGLNDLALIPGTASLWGVGSRAAKTGAKAVIWAYGAIG